MSVDRNCDVFSFSCINLWRSFINC